MVKKNMNENDGFTLAELLIVVAIIGVLVAISIPIFPASLKNPEKQQIWLMCALLMRRSWPKQ